MSPTRILLLRGVNVGGVKLPMAAFSDMLSGLGLSRVRSHIQSGNAVFDDPGLPDLKGAIAQGLQAAFGLSSALFVYDVPDFDGILSACPFAAEGAADGAKVHAFMLASPAQPDMAALEARATTERFHMTQAAFYLYTPDGIGRSVLVEKLPRLLGVVHTARNWNTMRALSDLAKS